MTPLSALAELLVGALVLAGCAYPGTAKALMSAFGVVMLAFGLVVALAPQPFAADWNYTARNGIFYAVVGAVLVLSAMISPVFSLRRQVVVHGSPPGATDRPGVPVGRPAVAAGDVEAGRPAVSAGRRPAAAGRKREPLPPDEVPADPLAPQLRQRSR